MEVKAGLFSNEGISGTYSAKGLLLALGILIDTTSNPFLKNTAFQLAREIDVDSGLYVLYRVYLDCYRLEITQLFRNPARNSAYS